MSEQVKQNFITSGFVPKYEKSKWPPIKHLIFLGCSIDTDRSVIKIPNDRLQKVLKTVDDIEFYITKYGKVLSRLVASLVGLIVSNVMRYW